MEEVIMGWETWIITTFSRSLAYGTPLLLGTLGAVSYTHLTLPTTPYV